MHDVIVQITQTTYNKCDKVVQHVRVVHYIPVTNYTKNIVLNFPPRILSVTKEANLITEVSWPNWKE
jgi:hypothetical protein